MVDVIEPTEAMVNAGVDAYYTAGTITGILRAALNHPDARGLFVPPAPLRQPYDPWPPKPAAPVTAAPTVSVRVPVIVAGTGQWAAWANHQDTDDKDGVAADALDAVTQDPGNVQRYYLTATLPLPQPVDIAAGVEGDHG